VADDGRNHPDIHSGARACHFTNGRSHEHSHPSARDHPRTAGHAYGRTHPHPLTSATSADARACLP
jgi:hypothetical protein